MGLRAAGLYCGLCKELKRRYGFSASFVFSYDFSFLALLQMGLAQHPAFHFDRERCPFHPTARPISVPEKAWLFRAKKSAFRKFYPYDYSISRQAGQLTTA